MEKYRPPLQTKYVFFSIYMMLPNSTVKFRGVIVGSMGTTNYHSTRGRQPRLVGEKHKNSNHREDDEPGEETGQTNEAVLKLTLAT
ncbi:hypothetical protein TNCV_932471 [Trichonephila clavipes]|nr:hypothetical protein TNCV_932471 [Trichonephila clavipes]